MYLLFFFFKQKTAYEMRISDLEFRRVLFRSKSSSAASTPISASSRIAATVASMFWMAACSVISMPKNGIRSGSSDRSEEHTSELQSLMRISYAGFCLKKKMINNIHKSAKDE